ncbi:MAG: hypothetical protein ACN23H_00310 [Candidatus Phytoplasma vitis]|nr:MAG: hypothetical protein M6G77_02585 [Candidatus Phytoplasma vitis]
MKKIKLFKLICFFTVIILDIIVTYNFLIKNPKDKFVDNDFLNLILECIIYGIFSFFSLGMFFYILFKITKGPRFIYKDPSKGKKFENIQVSESLWSYYFPRKIIPYNNRYIIISFLLAIIFLIVSIITKLQYIWLNGLFISSIVILFILCFYDEISYGSNFWVIYVKFYKWLGFSWFEKDFNKTIAKNNYFLISKQYYKKQKNK